MKKRLESSRDLGSEDLSELSEGEKEKGGIDSPGNGGGGGGGGGVMTRINSDLASVWSGEDGAETKRVYIVLIR